MREARAFGWLLVFLACLSWVVAVWAWTSPIIRLALTIGAIGIVLFWLSEAIAEVRR